MNAHYSCRSNQHTIARRQFLGTVAGGVGMGGLGLFQHPAVANELKTDHKRMVVFDMHGGLSQLESWDPKPGTDTGGPFLSIPTSVPGIHISELLPLTAQQMQHLCLLRSVNTSEGAHDKSRYMIETGRRRQPGVQLPTIGAVVARACQPTNDVLPGHIVITPGGGGGRGNNSAYLGPQYSSISLGGGKPPTNTSRPDSVTENSDKSRQDFRRKINNRFLNRRRTAFTEAYTYSYEQALQLMQKRDIFDVSHESAKDQERYGTHDFGRHCLLARRLLEQGITYVEVTHSNYDTHNENFNFHLEQMGEFDRGFANFVHDLAERGMLDSTLIVVFSEFGRTPRINPRFGRDHWGNAWSVCMGGARIPRGATYGKTNENGTQVIEGEVDHGNLFHTYLAALGLDSTSSFDIDGREIPMADPASSPITEILT